MFFGINAIADATLYFNRDPHTGERYQSGVETLTSLGVNGLAVYIGGVPGIMLGLNYIAIEGQIEQIQDNTLNNRPATFNLYNPELGW